MASSLVTDIQFSVIDIVSMAVIIFVILIGIPGNTLVIYVFGYRKRNKRTRTELLLLILGVIDLFSILTVPTTFFYLTVTNFQAWHFGYLSCKIIPSLLQITVTMSQGILILICYERYCAIMYPFEPKRISYPGVVFWFIVCIALSIVFVYPYAYSLDIVKNEKYGLDTCFPRGDRIDFLLASSSIQIFRDGVSVCVMVILSWRMNQVLSYNSEAVNWNRSIMSAKSRKVIKQVVVVFTFLCLPLDVFHFVYYLLATFTTLITHDIYKIMRGMNTVLSLLQISNAVVNIFIYSKMHEFFCIKNPLAHKRTPCKEVLKKN